MDKHITTTFIKDLLVIERPAYPDSRGVFQEIWRVNDIEEAVGRPIKLIQGNFTISKPKSLRGIHAEEMDKLVTPLSGLVFCAAVDLREDSPTFGKHATFVIDNRKESVQLKTLFLPKGVANSFCVMGDEDIRYLYAVGATYDGRPRRAIIWKDPDLNIKWPFTEAELLISDLDKKNKTMRELFPGKFGKIVS